MRDRTLYTVPMDDHAASELAIRDAVRVRDLWHFHGITRRLTERLQAADLARFYEGQVVKTANAIIARAEAR